MEGSVLTKIVLPLALFAIMLGMGLSLIPADFRRVMRFPKAVAVGMLFQLIALPVLGFVVVHLFRMEGALGVGLVALALCPGGTTSNMISFLSKGDVALSITLTAIVSIVTPFTIPLVLVPTMDAMMGSGQHIQLPIGQTIIQLLAITVLPVGIGMLIRKKAPKAAAKSEGAVRILSVVFLFAVIAGIMKQTWAELPGFFAQTGLAALTLNAASMAVGFFGAQLLKLSKKQAITIGIEVGIQNGTTALLVTSTLLANPTMSIAPAIYSLIMFATGAVFGVLVNLRKSPEGGASPA